MPVYETNSASQVSWIFNDSKVTLAIAEDDGQRDKIESVRDEVPTLRNVFVIEAGGLNAIKTYGESVTDANSGNTRKPPTATTAPPSSTHPALQAPRRAWN